MEATKGNKFRRCWMQASRYIFFFALYASWRHLPGVLAKWDLASVSPTPMSWTLSIPFFQGLRIRRFPFYSVASKLFFVGGCVNPDGCAFVFCTAQPVNMRRLLHTCVGVKSLPTRYVTLPQSTLWCAVTRPPLLQSRAWHMEKVVLQPSHNLDKSGGSRPYHRKRASRHSCAASSVSLTVDDCTVSHDPVFISRHKWRETWNGAPSRFFASSSSDRKVFLFLTYSIPSLMQAAWSLVLNSSWPLSTATRCTVITQDAVQFSGAGCLCWYLEGQTRLFHCQGSENPPWGSL